MTEEPNNQQDPAEAKAEATAPAVEEPPAPKWEAQLNTYPTRPEGENDPRWALNVFYIWATFVIAAMIFMVVLLALGFWYD